MLATLSGAEVNQALTCSGDYRQAALFVYGFRALDPIRDATLLVLVFFAVFSNHGFQGFGKLSPQEVRQGRTPLPRVLQPARLNPQVRTQHVPPVLPRIRERHWIHEGRHGSSAREQV